MRGLPIALAASLLLWLGAGLVGWLTWQGTIAALVRLVGWL